jgi:adenosylmethionine-8-amino-7-oxononanoate aminotransferase
MTVDSGEERIFHRVLKDTWQKISHGEGVYLFDTEGRRYMDACAGVHVVSIGHGVPEIAAAMAAQARKVTFTYSRFLAQSQIDLADKITAMTPEGLDRVFYISGGSEATESALKIARKYHLETGSPRKYKVISRWQSWHGNTIGAMSMSGRSVWRQDYAPYLLDFPHISPPFCAQCARGGCNHSAAEELERVIYQEGSEQIAAFIAEPVLGTSAAGVTGPPEYFTEIREICDRHNILLIVDEVVTGFGRTGKPFGIDHWGVVPDIMATGKGLSSGYTPLAATITHEKIYQAIYKSQSHYVHGHTYGGNPLSCAVGLAVQEYIENHGLIGQCAEMGDLMLEEMKGLEASPIVSIVRGKGLLLGVEFVADKETLEPFEVSRGVTGMMVDRAFDKGVLIMPGAPGLIEGNRGDHIAVSPPFIINAAQVRETVGVLKEVVDEVAAELGY